MGETSASDTEGGEGIDEGPVPSYELVLKLMATMKEANEPTGVALSALISLTVIIAHDIGMPFTRLCSTFTQMAFMKYKEAMCGKEPS